MDDIHFEPFVIESGGQFGEKAQQVFTKMRIEHCIFLEVKTPGDPRSNNVFQRAEMV